MQKIKKHWKTVLILVGVAAQGILISCFASEQFGNLDVVGDTIISTNRITAGFADEGYEYSLNNQNGIIAVNFNTVDFDEIKTNGNGIITDSNPNDLQPDPGFTLPPAKDINYFEELAQEKAKYFMNCPNNIDLLMTRF